MVITYHGGQMVKITSGETVIVFNPIPKTSKMKPVRFGSDLVLISRYTNISDGISEVTRKDREPFVIDSPGEYEVMNVFVNGTASKSEYEKEGINTIYAVKVEDINIVNLGFISEPKPDMSFMEDMDNVDIVFVPIGGEGTLEVSDAYSLAVSLEPKIIIPVHWMGVGSNSAIEDFKKEAGSSAQEEEKITIKKKDLVEGVSSVVVLKS